MRTFAKVKVLSFFISYTLQKCLPESDPVLECCDPGDSPGIRRNRLANYPEDRGGQRGGAALEEDTMDMAALLAQEETTQFHSLRRGEVVEGTIIGINRDGVVVDIGAKS